MQKLYDPEPLRKARKARYTSQTAFADVLKTTRQTVSRLENATEVSLHLLNRACTHLGLHAEISITEKK